jgi:hypothetical protein
LRHAGAARRAPCGGGRRPRSTLDMRMWPIGEKWLFCNAEMRFGASMRPSIVVFEKLFNWQSAKTFLDS